MVSGAIYARIVSQYSDKGSKQAQKDIAKTAKKIDAFNKKIVKSYVAAAAAAAFLAYKVGKVAVKSAIEDAKSQEILANSLRSSTNATDAQIAAVEAYIDKQQLLTNVQDTELRASYATLVNATKNATQAQYLQTLATDVAIGANKDLTTVTNAFAKAAQGNLKPLERLNLGLDRSAIAAGDFESILGDLGKTFGGVAAEVAKKDPFTKLKIQFGEAAEKLGVALLPALTDVATRISTEVVPAIEKFVEANQELITQSLVDLVLTIERIAIVGLKLVQFLSQFEALLAAIAFAAPFGFLAAQIMLVGRFAKTTVGFLKNLNSTLLKYVFPTVGRVAVSLGALASVFTTGGLAAGFQAFITLAAKAYKPLAALVFIVGALYGGYKLLVNLLDKGDSVNKTTAAMEEQGRAATRALKTNRETAAQIKDRIANEKDLAAGLARSAAAQRKALEEQKKAAKFEADYKKLNATLAKRAGVSLLSPEDEKMVQIKAAIALTDRQKAINAADREKLYNLEKEVLLQKVRMNLTLRYSDILAALADAKIDSKDIAVLAGKWGVTTEAAKTYIETIFAIEDGTISDDEIIKLAQSWGSTQAQAAQYLDFFVALNDGVLSDAEIEKLKAKWKLTEEQVRMYADFVGVVNDGKLEDAEIIKIKDKWKLTTDQVVDYILKIGSPVSYSGTLIEPGRAAELSWLNATAALERYMALLRAGTGVLFNNSVTAPAPNTDGNSAAAISAAAVAAVQAAAAADDAAAAVAESEAAVAAAMAAALEAASASAASTIELEKLFPDLMRSVELLTLSQEAKEESGRSFLTDAEMDRLLAKVDGPSSFLGGSTTDSAADAAEKARIRGLQSGVMSGAGNFQNSMAGNVTVNITVEGSVTAEQDLVSAVREGLLGTQYNGSQINLQAV